MNFDPTEEEQAIRDLTAQILGDLATHARMRDLTLAGASMDDDAWTALAEAGIVGASLPEAHGGAGLGFLATALACEQVGATAAPVPLLATTVLGGLPIAEFGTADQQLRWLPGIADGSVIATAALTEAGTRPSAPVTEATADGDGYRLHGTKPLVPAGLDAGVVLVPATRPDGTVGVFVVPTDAEGLHRQRVETTTTRPDAAFVFDGVAVSDDDLLGGGSVDGVDIVEWIELRANVAMCVMLAGAAQAAIEMTSDYAKERQQFERPIATFQAVTQRAGDSFIDTEAMRLTAYQAAWRIDAGLPATREAHIAKYWASEGGFRVAHATVHVHGGVGVDRDYPLHRHFLLARQVEMTLGHAEEHLEDLGAAIAAG